MEPEQPKIIPCSSVICARGHEWLAQMQIAKCRGCNSDVLAIRVINCPVCNEPAEKFSLRLDQVATVPALQTGMQITPICRGAQSGAIHTGVLELERHVSEDEEKLCKMDQSVVGPVPGDIAACQENAPATNVGSAPSTAPAQLTLFGS